MFTFHIRPSTNGNGTADRAARLIDSAWHRAQSSPAMCNLYRLTSPRKAVADMFGADPGIAGNEGEEIYPGYPGLVIASRTLQTMTWGFPLVLKGKSGQPLKPKPVNNARTDKMGSAFWRTSFAQRRCLIPVSAFAEAEGPKGQMTRTWLSLPDQPVIACAGIWRDSAEWGLVYSMVMTDAAEQTASVHDRMPVILATESIGCWLTGTPEEALALCRPWTAPITIERTAEPWVHRHRA